MKFANFGKVGVIATSAWLAMPKTVWAATGPFCNAAGTQINTALGCVPVDMGAFVGWLATYLFGIAGGISFLLMAYGFILMQMSAGDPKAIAGAQETVTSAITGLLVSIFSLFLLRLITVGILKIPGIN